MITPAWAICDIAICGRGTLYHALSMRFARSECEIAEAMEGTLCEPSRVLSARHIDRII